MSQPTLLRVFFYHLYHTFAWAYDVVAALVSLGQWNEWIEDVRPFLSGSRLLELGHGPGHLQRSLRDLGWAAVGIDESAPMGRLARRRLLAAGKEPAMVRALAQALPFPSAAFDTVVATFPTEYILDERTARESLRVLKPDGRLVILLNVFFAGHSMSHRFLRRLYRFTRQTAPTPSVDEFTPMRDLFLAAGYRQVKIHTLAHGETLLTLFFAFPGE
ncbi:MAG: class I SAM-dependent methyltransferase [Anaerolineae bacterium]